VACTEKKSAAATESKSSDEDLMIYPLWLTAPWILVILIILVILVILIILVILVILIIL
jgi:hypothetical protein